MAERAILDVLAQQFKVNLGAARQFIKCPWHNDEKPSMSIYLAPMGEEHVHCFSCKYHSSLTKFIADVRQVSIGQLLSELGIKRDSRAIALERITQTFADELEKGTTICTSGEKTIASEFLVKSRGHDLDTLKKFRVGVATDDAFKKILEDNEKSDLKKLKLLSSNGTELLVPTGAIVFPVMIGGQVVGLRWKRYSLHKAIGKENGQMHKTGWLNFIAIYNFDAINHESEELWIVEGEDDVLRLAAVGVSTIAFIGTTSSRDKRFPKLKNCPAKKIVVATDNDDAGNSSRKNLLNYLRKEKKESYSYVPQMKDVSDDLNLYTIEDMRGEVKQAVVEFREVGGAYWDGQFKLSTFVFDLKAKIIAEAEIYLVLELKGEKEPEAQTIIIPNRLVADKGEFNRFIKRHGCYAWLSGANQLDDIITKKWNEKMPIHHAITYVGLVDIKEYEEKDDRRVHVMHDRMLMPGGKEQPSDGGVFWLSKTRGLFLDVANKFSFTTEGIIANTEHFDELKKVLWIPEYTISLGWFLAIPWMREIQNILGGFPTLWLTGEKESGKTTFASFLMGLFYPLERLKETIDAFISPARTTPEGLSLALSRYSGLPVLFDDFRSNVRYSEEFLETFRVLYDRFTIQKGKLRSRDSLTQSYETRKLRAALIVTSQHTPEDEAVSQRTLEVDFKKTQLRGDILAMMRATIRELYPIGVHFISRSLDESFKDKLDIALSLLGPEVVSSRKMQAVGVACAGLLKAGYTEKEIKQLIKKLNVSHQKFEDDTDEVEDFFDYIRTAASRNIMDIQRFIGWKEEGVWLAPSQLYDISKPWHGGRAAFTRRSIKKLLMAQDGAISFKTKSGITKEKVVGVKVSDDKWTVVRAVFFRFKSPMGIRIKKLLSHEDDLVVEDAEEAAEEEPALGYEKQEDDPFAGQF